MKKNFVPVSFEDQALYYDFWQKTPQHSIDYTLVNLWGWQTYFGLEWCFANDLCWIRQNKPASVLWTPLGDWPNINWQQVFAECETKHLTFIRVPEQLVKIWQAVLADKVHVEEDRGQWEYLYQQQHLATLAGPAFHKKKNRYNTFLKEYGQPDYRVLDDNTLEDILALEDDWCQWHECENSPSLRAENEAINRVLAHWDHFAGLYVGSLYVDGRMAAFSVGEKLDTQNLGVHYEKGLNGYKGIYQVINREFVAHAGNGFALINRAQDLDEDGLRQAKMSYQPTDFLRKYKVKINL